MADIAHCPKEPWRVEEIWMSILLSHVVLVTLTMYRGTIYVDSPSNHLPSLYEDEAESTFSI